MSELPIDSDDRAGVTFCAFVQGDDGKWWCPACDPEMRHTLAVRASRNCGRGPSQVPESGVLPHRELVAQSIRAALDNYAALPHRTDEEALATLDVCLTRCPLGKYDIELGTCTRWGSACQMYHRWIRALVVTGCDAVPTPAPSP